MHSSSCLHSSSISLSDRAVANVLQGGCPGEQYRGEEALGMHSQHYVARATNIREFFSSFTSFLLAVLDSSLLVVVNRVYKLEQHMEAWAGCVCVSANTIFFKKLLI